LNNNVINGAMLRDMFLSGAALLEQNKKAVDALNVFPVPDGDTGTNMSMTMQGAVKNLRLMPTTVGCDAVMSAVASGSLRGARGNSGVILSQLLRGFSKVVKGCETIDVKMLIDAFVEGTACAYKAVMKPKEGTILTVSRMVSEHLAADAANLEKLEMTEVFKSIIQVGEQALENTPNLLPVLKEAGVVDSGGKGLMIIYRGFYYALCGKEIPDYVVVEAPVLTNATFDIESFSTDTIEYGYCSEFFIVHLKDGLTEEGIDLFRQHLMRIGDSVVVASDTDLIKVHVHSNCPGKILQLALRLGEIDRIKIDNMREQNRQLLEARKANEKEYAIIAVSAGDGLDEIFKSINVDRLISGGQTMNPSIDTIVNAIKQVNARHVFVLPNNSNIIMAADQAKDLCDCDVTVLRTKTIPQGISAAIAFNPDNTLKQNITDMTEAYEGTLSGAITYAVRDTQFNGQTINEGDIIGLIDNNLCLVKPSVFEAASQLLVDMIEDHGVDSSVSIYYGDGVDEEAANTLAEEIAAKYDDADVNVYSGGQPLYYFYFAVM